MKSNLEERYDKLDDMMKMWFKQESVIRAWDISADQKNQKARQYNEQKKWWQKKKPDNFPHYFATPLAMPILSPVPPTWHKQYKQAKKLLEDYMESA